MTPRIYGRALGQLETPDRCSKNCNLQATPSLPQRYLRHHTKRHALMQPTTLYRQAELEV